MSVVNFYLLVKFYTMAAPLVAMVTYWNNSVDR